MRIFDSNISEHLQDLIEFLVNGDKNPLSSFHVPKARPQRELKAVGFLSE